MDPENLASSRIEYPGYEPHPDTAREWLSAIRQHDMTSYNVDFALGSTRG
ncbi:hypothetical protein [Paraburkholderia ginsengiterrae]|nr:hypothetical protein [Paraburkholderia ginsengiterrae]